MIACDFKVVPVFHCNQGSDTRTKFRRAVLNRLIFNVCRFQELKAIEQLVSLLNEQPEEVMLKRSLASVFLVLALNIMSILEFTDLHCLLL